MADYNVRDRQNNGRAVEAGEDILSGEVSASENSKVIMERIGQVLDPTGGNRLTEEQRNLFSFLTRQVAEYEGDRKCPIVSLVDHVGNYWRNWLLLIGRTGPYRPSTIMKLLEAIDPSHPISYRMLTLNLRLLERDGLIRRRVISEEFNHVDYALTPLGQELSTWILSLVEWTDRHADAVEKARALFDAADRY